MYAEGCETNTPGRKSARNQYAWTKISAKPVRLDEDQRKYQYAWTKKQSKRSKMGMAGAFLQPSAATF